MVEAVETTPRAATDSADLSASIPRADPFGLVGDVGAAFVVALGLLIAGVLGLQVSGVRPLHIGVAGVLTIAGFLVMFGGALAWLRRGELAERGQRFWSCVVAAGPALALVAYQGAARLLTTGVRTEWFLGGDHVRHLIMTAEAQSTGALSYSTIAYPRGWHMVLAALWSALGLDPRTDLATVADVSSMAVWGLSAGLALATSALAASFAMRCGLGLRPAALAGALAGLMTYLPWFLGNYQALGFETSLLGAWTLAVVLRCQLVAAERVATLVVSAAGVVVLAHTWQLLLPVVGLAALRSAVPVARRHGKRGLALVAVLGGGSLAASMPALKAVFTDIGIEHATDAGVEVPVPWVLLVLVASSALWLAVRFGPGLAWPTVLMAVPAATGLAVAARVGITPDTYYPAKLLWHTAVLGLAPVSVMAVKVALWLRGRVWAPVRVMLASVTALAVVYVVALPTAAFVGVWSTANGPAMLRLLSTPGAGEAQVVWSDEGVGTDTLARVFLDVIRPNPGPIRTPQGVLGLQEECDLLQASTKPTVLTDRPPADVRARYACSPALQVVAAAP